jgi:DNA helicase II / ATP-dependent DNA helicase PcrA
MFKPRPKQKMVLAYRNGKMGVSAVPGSGKTHTLSCLAADLIAGGSIEDDQEVLIVTLVNSAVDNFSQRIGGFIEEKGLLPHLGYRVRTLHGLAHDIVRERPTLAGLANDFQIIDERAANQILEEAVQSWLRNNPAFLDSYFKPELDENYRLWLQHKRLPEIINRLANSFISYAKNLQLTPEKLGQRLEGLPVPLPLAQMGWAIYSDYERALLYRGAVDFDDLVRLALQTLQQDEKLVERLHHQWPFILEDEAQDSNLLQEEIIQLISGPDGNWVRVGDPNQAIFETFTTAKPKYFRAFLERKDVSACDLPNSGRSTRSIISLANHLIEWSRTSHPVLDKEYTLDKPLIKPTPRRDPQPNPEDSLTYIRLVRKKYSPENELLEVAKSLNNWLPDHPDSTVAVLVPRNTRGFELGEVLKQQKIEFVEMLKSSNATRLAAGSLAHLLAYLADPGSPRKLADVYRTWRRAGREESAIDSQDSYQPHTDKMANLIGKCHQVETFLWPRPDNDWLESIKPVDGEDPEQQEELIRFREIVRRWQGTALLPIDQIVLILAQDLFTTPADLAVAHKLAIMLRQASETHLDWRLPQLSEEIAVIARNQRRFLGFSQDDTSFDPEKHKGKVVISTIHKAKGLEWDRIYMMSVNNYDFPSGMEFDSYISEKEYFRNHLNLEAEALAQVDAAISNDEYTWYEEGKPTAQARLDYTAERLRLLYVGITRAKKELILTWNTGRDGSQQPAIPFVELQTFWENNHGSAN